MVIRALRSPNLGSSSHSGRRHVDMGEWDFLSLLESDLLDLASNSQPVTEPQDDKETEEDNDG